MITVRGELLEVRLDLSPGAPVTMAAARPRGGGSLVAPHPLLVVFTATERQLSRMSHGYADSAIGRRLRYVSHCESRDEHATRVEILQRDPASGLAVTTALALPHDAAAIGFSHRVTNDGDGDVVLLALSSATVGFGAGPGMLDPLELLWADSGWTAEGRWHQRPLRDLLPRIDLGRYGQDVARRFGRTSRGTWSTGEALPGGVVVDGRTGGALAWQIESSGPWHWEVGHTPGGGYVAVLGPTDAEHGFATRLAPGDTYDAPPAAVALSAAGRDGAFAALTDYRRSRRERRAVDATLPVVYNDFMNTLAGDPSAEKLAPLIGAAADAGAEYFCIDAGWFADADEGDWWDRIGEWREGRGRFTGGLRSVVRLIRARGMVPGLWLEPEVVGVAGPVASALPDEAFFRRFGVRVVTHGRYHLDVRHPAARAHLDSTIDELVERYGIGYFKLDYNIDPGAGTDVAATSAAEGLLGHVRAHRRWLADVQERHPAILFENCAAGAMRMDPGLLSLAHLQSTSDQPDDRAYVPIASAAPASMPPEQCGNWAYPAADMDPERTAFSLVAGLAGRLYLSGFLDRLDAVQRGLVHDAVAVAKAWRHRVAGSHPVWPLGLPAWDDAVVALALDCGDDYLLAVWSRGDEADVTMELPAPVRPPDQVFPATLPSWRAAAHGHRLALAVPAGPAARLLRLKKGHIGT
ncbi:glycoside hydrolase family 36 protein [Jiangella anatolica]|uniref:Alpha-galactosidase n=1 Tax=Jiangella anatolica TaxID=2670374 RepID=A0A2W2AXV4_9ACTN|nr:glycoside hydrolase family 36 protein [Jiangella anatolica]PZF80041.1 alpha-galactosidase [Jiangella anatolica]